MNQLEEQIEAIRKQAYDAGYATAMRAIREFAGGSPNAAAPAVVSRRRKSPAVAKAQSRPSSTRPSKPKSTTASMPRSRPQPSQPNRGSNALLIAEVLKGTSGPTRAADIRKTLQRDKGVSIAFASHAMRLVSW
jgi:hypothetical protein